MKRIQDVPRAGWSAPGQSGPGAGTLTPDRPRPAGIRQALPGDCAALETFLAGLSPQSRYLRFFTGAPAVSGAALRRLAGDGDNLDVIVATEDGTIIGHALAADGTDATGAHTAEIGVVVTDARQGRGVGSALTATLAAHAAARGASTVTMDVLAENSQALAMIAGQWPDADYHRSGPYVTIHARLAGPEGGTTP